MVGDCYEAAGNYIIENSILGGKRGLILVHGEVAGQGPLEGIQFGHAWVLDGNRVIDNSNGRKLRMSKAEYYAIGKIYLINNYIEYTAEQARKKMVQYETYGPWELRTSSGL